VHDMCGCMRRLGGVGGCLRGSAAKGTQMTVEVAECLGRKRHGCVGSGECLVGGICIRYAVCGR
jgi:hypothetical protein